MLLSYLDMFLIIALVAALGVLLFNKFLSKNKTTPVVVNNFNRNYLTGINYLLNNQQSEAIDLFIKLVEVDKETIEVHLILGNIFRKQGYLEKAIKVHQNILSRSGLKKSVRAEAMFELAQDYSKAGLLDRAESLLQAVIESDKFYVDATKSLIDIYETESEWEHAIESIKNLRKVKKNTKLDIRLSHYYCQLFDKFEHTKDNRRKKEVLRLAFLYYDSNPRALIQEGKLYIEQGDYNKAFKSFLRIDEKNPKFFALVVDNLLDIKNFLSVTNQRKMVQIIKEKYKNNINISLKMYNYLFINDNKDDAIDFLRSQVIDNPSLQGLLELLRASLKETAENEKWLNIFKKSLHAVLNKSAKYVCHNCGYKTQAMNWYCPGCKKWQTIEPTTGIDSL
jgi:lipopolysaccharide assembly protein B